MKNKEIQKTEIMKKIKKQTIIISTANIAITTIINLTASSTKIAITIVTITVYIQVKPITLTVNLSIYNLKYLLMLKQCEIYVKWYTVGLGIKNSISDKNYNSLEDLRECGSALKFFKNFQKIIFSALLFWANIFINFSSRTSILVWIDRERAFL